MIHKRLILSHCACGTVIDDNDNGSIAIGGWGGGGAKREYIGE